MPVIKQAIKKVRQDKRKTAFNLRVKNAFKNAVREFKKKPTEAALRGVYKALDRAAKTKVIHRNKASRLKSRLSKLVNGHKSKAVGKKSKAGKEQKKTVV